MTVLKKHDPNLGPVTDPASWVPVAVGQKGDRGEVGPLPTDYVSDDDLAAALEALPTYEALGAAEASMGVHLAAPDPHSQYMTDGELATALAAGVAAHEAAADPHPGYVDDDELAAALEVQSLADRNRANHFGQQTSATISDFTEAVQDAVAALLGAGSNVTLLYDDEADTLTVSVTGGGSSGLDAEAVRDAIGVALVGVGNIAVAVNDEADTITLSTTATVNSTDAQLRDRTTHTGVQAIATVTGLQAALDSKEAAGAAAALDATLATVAKTGAYSDLTGTPTIPPAGIESIVAGTNITVDASDPANPVVSASGGDGDTGADPIHTPPATPNSRDDEFQDLAGQSGPVNGFAAKWTRRGLPGTQIRWDYALTKEGSVLLETLSGDAYSAVIHQPAPTGDFTAVCRAAANGVSPITGTSRQLWGLVAVNDVGTGLAMVADPTALPAVYNLTTWDISTKVGDLSAVSDDAYYAGVPYRFLLSKVGTSHRWSLRRDVEGENLFNIAPGFDFTHTTALTITRIGFGRVYSPGTGPGKHALDYFRVTQP